MMASFRLRALATASGVEPVSGQGPMRATFRLKALSTVSGVEPRSGQAPALANFRLKALATASGMEPVNGHGRTMATTFRLKALATASGAGPERDPNEDHLPPEGARHCQRGRTRKRPGPNERHLLPEDARPTGVQPVKDQGPTMATLRLKAATATRRNP